MIQTSENDLTLRVSKCLQQVDIQNLWTRLFALDSMQLGIVLFPFLEKKMSTEMVVHKLLVSLH